MRPPDATLLSLSVRCKAVFKVGVCRIFPGGYRPKWGGGQPWLGQKCTMEAVFFIGSLVETLCDNH